MFKNPKIKVLCETRSIAFLANEVLYALICNISYDLLIAYLGMLSSSCHVWSILGSLKHVFGPGAATGSEHFTRQNSEWSLSDFQTNRLF